MSNDYFVTPVGRIVYGSVWTPNETDIDGRPLTTSSGAPRKEWAFGLAISKADPGWPAVAAKITEVAQAGFPTHPAVQQPIGSSGFSWKVLDGDSPQVNRVGAVPPNQREGYPGCYVLKLKTGIAPKCFGTGGESVLTDPESIKRGYYVRVNVSIAPNGQTQQPGIYLNPMMVEFIAYGEVIQSGPDARTVFSAPAGALPPGASAAPVAPSTPPLAPPAVPGPATVQPAPAFLNPPAPPAPPPPPATPSPVMYSVGGQQYTADQLRGFGWTEEQINGAPRA